MKKPVDWAVARVVVPDLQQAEKILHSPLNSYDALENGAQRMLALGCKSVLLRGGHVNDPLFSQNYWTNGEESFWLANHRYPDKKYDDSGDMLSPAIAACLAAGYPVKDALVIATMSVHREIRQGRDPGLLTAPVFQDGGPEEQADLPFLSPKPIHRVAKSFRRCQPGLYPVVDSSLWLEKLLPQGIRHIQLRIKNASKVTIEDEIKRSVFLAEKYGAILFVNDYWELAIHYGAGGVHLGQEDLQEADIDKIHGSGLYLGVSTHCYYEVARAHALNPSYIACGPIYPTTSKVMPYQPQGIGRLQRWRCMLHYPLVAIGGMNADRVPEVLKSGVKGVALISAITAACDPIAATRQLLAQINGTSQDELQ